MATWMVHLRIADAVLNRHNWLEPDNFLIGSIAPDSGIPDANWQNFDPPYTATHFCEEKLFSPSRDMEFFQLYLKGRTDDDEIKKTSFRWGYFAHLVTDNLWNAIRREAFERFRAHFPTEEEYVREIKADWYGLDFLYLHEHHEAGFWQRFLTCVYVDDAVDLIPAQALNMRVEYIREFYQRTDEKVITMRERPFKYLSKRRMDRFVKNSSDLLIDHMDKLRPNPDPFSTQNSIFHHDSS